MSIDDAIRRWWQHERPGIERVLRHAYNVGSLSDDVAGMLHRGLREAFIAGWNARARVHEAAGDQESLFTKETP